MIDLLCDELDELEILLQQEALEERDDILEILQRLREILNSNSDE